MPSIVFDVDGTLLTATEPPEVRDDVVNLLFAFYELGWHVYAHSGGGQAYAAQRLRDLGLDRLKITVEIKGNKNMKYDICVDDCIGGDNDDMCDWSKIIKADYFIKV